MALTCDPIMVLLEDIEFIDRIVQERCAGIDIHTPDFRKKLIAERKTVVHEMVTEYKERRTWEKSK